MNGLQTQGWWGGRVASTKTKKGDDLSAHSSVEKMPLATVPQGNEESRGGRHREGEQKSEEREKEGDCYFPWRLPPNVSPFFQ